ncbi:MAG TPA: SGNH/GDSL hydrolase family protein [Chloroflexia bacterium]|nr:SGNH/GDSL hydrolase family protein [Chloroflexia bacterium]
MLAVVLLTLCPAFAAQAGPVAPSIVGYPASMASTGDSITRAFNTGTIPFTDAPSNSWSTGTNASVISNYSRILANQPLMAGHGYNDAVTGAQMADLNAQAGSAVSQGVEYITILMGANDACTSSESEMTPVATYRAQFESALDRLTSGRPDARIYVLSVPDIYNLWFVLHDNSSARTAWSFYGICQSMLANPLSNEQPDIDRRARVRQRVIDYNSQLAQVCATRIHCRFDGNAIFNTLFQPSDVSTRDYFHPSIQGQGRLADVSYNAGFDFRDGVHPASVASLTKGTAAKAGGGSYQVAITAHDNVGVSGIEYRLNNGPFTRYTAPVALPQGSTLIYRAVDVNGNVEPARTFAP